MHLVEVEDNHLEQDFDQGYYHTDLQNALHYERLESGHVVVQEGFRCSAEEVLRKLGFLRNLEVEGIVAIVVVLLRHKSLGVELLHMVAVLAADEQERRHHMVLEELVIRKGPGKLGERHKRVAADVVESHSFVVVVGFDHIGPEEPVSVQVGHIDLEALVSEEVVHKQYVPFH